jgi:hypothetical protein
MKDPMQTYNLKLQQSVYTSNYLFVLATEF